MAKSTFQRSKPHLNIGTLAHAIDDTSGELTFDAWGSEEQGGDPEANILLFMTAPSASSPQRSIVVFPLDDQWQYTPLADAPILSIETRLDLLPLRIEGDAFQVTLAIVQGDGDSFLGRIGNPAVTTGDEWLTLGDVYTSADAFAALDGGGRNPDFNQPFQFGFAFIGEHSGEGLAVELAMDELQVEITAVPEPASLALLASLAGALLLTRRRR